MPALHRLLPQLERVPDNYRAVITRRCESLSIRREGHRRDPVCVIIEGRQPFAPREVPDDHLLVFADRYQQAAIRRKDGAAHGCRVPIAHYFLFPHFAHRHHGRRRHCDSRNHDHQQRKLCQTVEQAFSDRLSFQCSAFQISKPPDGPERTERDARVLVRVI